MEKFEPIYQQFERKFAKNLGMTCMLLATFCWFVHNMVCKFVYTTSIQVCFTSNSIQICFVIYIMNYYKIKKIPEDTETRNLLILRGFVGSCSYICQLIAFQMISLAEHQAIFNLGPIWVGIMGYFILKEPYRSKEAISAILGLIGLVLIVKPPFIWYGDKVISKYEHDQLGKLIIFCGSFFYATLIIILRYLGFRITVFHSVLAFNIFNLAQSIIYLNIIELKPFAFADYFFIPIICITNFIGQILMSRGVMLVKPSRGTILQYLLIFLGYIADILVFHIIPNIYSAIGCFLIIFSAVIVFFLAEDSLVSKLQDSLLSVDCDSKISYESRVSII